MLILALTLPVLAFAPTDSPAEPGYVQSWNAGVQSRLRHNPAWQEFVAGEGAGWYARFDEQTGTAFRAFGPGIPMGVDANASSAKVEAAVRGFLDRTGLGGVPSRELVLKTASYSPETGIWYVDFNRVIPAGNQGAVLWKGGVTARIKNGNLVLFGVQTWPGVQGFAAPTVTADQAYTLAAVNGPIGLAARTDVDAELVVLPFAKDRDVQVKLAWKVRSDSTEPLGQWISFVDAQTGELLAYYNDIRFFGGYLFGEHNTRTVDGNMSVSALREIDLDGSNGQSYVTDSTGHFMVPDGLTLTAEFQGEYLTIENDDGGEAALEIDSSNANPVWTEDDATLAEIDSWVNLLTIRDWGLMIAPEVGMSTEPLVAKVNQRGTCNAYYDGNVNFYREGGGCNNSGQIADVAYHEWGHGFHYYSLEAGTFDGTLSEGLSDCVAFFQTLDATIAPDFMTNGSGIREVASDRVYPDDIVNETHTDGLIFAGAVWDLLDVMSDTYGETAYVDKGTAWMTTMTVFKDAIKAGPTLETVFDEFLLADDDDGDLSNGTPHICEIVDAFGRHGLGFAADSGLLTFDHTALDNQPARTAIPVAASLVNIAPQCNGMQITESKVHFSTDGGASWQEANLSANGDALSGEIPSQNADTIVSYYIEITGDDGTVLSWPPSGAVAPYTFYVGALTEVWCEDFNEDDGGFTHELLGGNDQEGADDWIYGTPGGLSGDPSSAFSGRSVWGNDRGGGNYNGAYQPSVTNRLSSVAIDTQGNTNLILQYRRWLNVEDGQYDHARVYANEAAIWENFASTDRNGESHTADVDWVLHTLRITGAASPLTLGWEIESDRGLEMGGWNVDDMCVYAISEAGPGDSATDDTGVPSGDDSGSDNVPGAGNSGEKIVLGGGCGCDSTPGAAVAMGGLFASFLLVSRRRRG